MARSLAILGLVLAGCGDASPPSLAIQLDEARSIVNFASKDDVRARAVRIDGGIQATREAQVTSPRPQVLVVTNSDAGEDQCKVIVLSRSGERLAEYQPPSDTPWPEPSAMAGTRGTRLRERVVPVASLVQTFQRDGRRFIAIGAVGLFAPSILVVLEATSPTKLEERFIFWNFGHIHCIAIDGSWLALAGLHNQLREHDNYRTVVAVFPLAEITRPRERSTARSPDPESVEPLASPLLYYWSPSNDRDWGFGATSLDIAERRIELTTGSGLLHTLDMDDASIGVSPSKKYIEELPRRRRRDSGIPALQDHLEELRKRTILRVRAVE